MSYARALERLRTLNLAHNALDLAIEQAVGDLVTAAESDRGEPISLIVGPLTPPRGRMESGTRLRDPRLERAIGGVEVERYVRAAWERAASDEDHERVRDLLAKSVEAGVLDGAAADRLTRLLAA